MLAITDVLTPFLQLQVQFATNEPQSYVLGGRIHPLHINSQLASVADLTNKNDYFINAKQGPGTKAQKEMMSNIDLISNRVQDGVKMNFMLDMEKKKYISVNKEEDIGLSLCSLHPVNASKPIVMLTEVNC